MRPDRREIGIVAFVQIERDLIRLCPWKEATETSLQVEVERQRREKRGAGSKELAGFRGLRERVEIAKNRTAGVRKLKRG